jgi:hypothetical protein
MLLGHLFFAKWRKFTTIKKRVIFLITCFFFNFLMLCHWLANRFLELVQIIYKLVKKIAIKLKSESNCDEFCFGNYAIIFEKKGIKL